MPSSSDPAADAAPLVLLSFCHGAGSGAERVLEHLLTAAVGGQTARRLVIVAPADSGVFAHASALGYRTLAWPARSPSAFRHDLPAAIKLWPNLRALRPAALHAWHARCFETTALLGAALGVPITGTLHDHPNARGYSRLRRWLMRWGASRMRQLACVSEALTIACREAGWRNSVLTIRNGLPDTPAVALGESRSPLRIAFLGCAEAWKGAAAVLTAMDRLKPLAITWNLYGPLTPASSPLLSAAIATASLRGRVPAEAIFPDNDLILHPSETFDPFPTVLLEAARAGKPVIATRVGGTAEIVSDGETGILVDPGDDDAITAAIETLTSDSPRRHAMALAARRRFDQNFSVVPMVAGYETLWRPFLTA